MLGLEPEDDLKPLPDSQIEALCDLQRFPEYIVRMAREIQELRSVIRDPNRL